MYHFKVLPDSPEVMLFGESVKPPITSPNYFQNANKSTNGNLYDTSSILNHNNYSDNLLISEFQKEYRSPRVQEQANSYHPINYKTPMMQRDINAYSMQQQVNQQQNPTEQVTFPQNMYLNFIQYPSLPVQTSHMYQNCYDGSFSNFSASGIIIFRKIL